MMLQILLDRFLGEVAGTLAISEELGGLTNLVMWLKGPIANAAYWFNQNVIDNVLRTTGRVATVSARFVYRYIDQRGVDGVYNGTAMVTGEGGSLLRKLQNGRLQEYALFMLFGVAAVALVLAIRF